MAETRDRNVFILGAGFSALAGAPLIHDFIDCSRSFFDDPSSKLEDTERHHFERFLKFKRTMSQAREKVRIDLDDIEQLFGLVEISQRLDPALRGTRDSTVYVIAKTLELATRGERHRRIGFSLVQETAARFTPPPSFEAQKSDPPSYIADLYDFFAALVAGLLDGGGAQATKANSVITFNYDLVLDDALRRVGVMPAYHLPHDSTLIEIADQSRPSCSLLKLHGSTNWGICGECRKEVLVLGEKVTASPAEFGSRRCRGCKAQSLQPLLIPPSWDKSEYREIMKPVWGKAVEELKHAARICVVGYSMPEADSFFKYLMALALSENHNLYKLVVVDTNPEIKARYESLFDQTFRQRRLSLHISGGGFGSFLGSGEFRTSLARGDLIGPGIWMT